MGFVTCKQLKEARENLKDEAIKAESALLECADKVDGVVTNPICLGNTGGVITVDNIKRAIADTGILLYENGELTLRLEKLGSILGEQEVSKAWLNALKTNGLLGDGLDVENGKLIIHTESIKDASGLVHQFYAVKKEGEGNDN